MAVVRWRKAPPRGGWIVLALLGLVVLNLARGASEFGVKPAGNGVRTLTYLIVPGIAFMLLRPALRLDPPRLAKWLIVTSLACTAVSLCRWAGVLPGPQAPQDNLREVPRVLPADYALILCQALLGAFCLWLARGFKSCLLYTSTNLPSTTAIPCVGAPGNTTGAYRQQCQTSAGAVYDCNNSAACAVASDWVNVGTTGSVASVTGTAGQIIATGSSTVVLSTPGNVTTVASASGNKVTFNTPIPAINGEFTYGQDFLQTMAMPSTPVATVVAVGTYNQLSVTGNASNAVSYTHLDVYKRQCPGSGGDRCQRN